MITEERLALEPLTEDEIRIARPRSRSLPRRKERIPQTRSPQPVSSSGKPSGLWRLILFFVGFALVSLGWPLVVSAVGAFIGVPLIIFGLALMQAQERS
jgi:hypothetical protein